MLGPDGLTKTVESYVEFLTAMPYAGAILGISAACRFSKARFISATNWYQIVLSAVFGAGLFGIPNVVVHSRIESEMTGWPPDMATEMGQMVGYGISVGGIIAAVAIVLRWQLRKESGLEKIPIEDFMQRTRGGWPVQMDLHIYEGVHYECVCGRNHAFDGSTVLRELGGMKLVVECPNDQGVTCIRIKGFIKYSFVSLFGSRDTEDRQ